MIEEVWMMMTYMVEPRASDKATARQIAESIVEAFNNEGVAAALINAIMTKVYSTKCQLNIWIG